MSGLFSSFCSGLGVCVQPNENAMWAGFERDRPRLLGLCAFAVRSFFSFSASQFVLSGAAALLLPF